MTRQGDRGSCSCLSCCKPCPDPWDTRSYGHSGLAPRAALEDSVANNC